MSAPAAFAASAAADGSSFATASEGLLPGWTAVWSRSRAIFYWKHSGTGATTWSKPTPMPEDWVEETADDGTIFYTNTLTYETAWERPSLA